MVSEFVRARVSPEEAGSLQIDPQTLCYVLQDRHLSSLLVLDEETDRLGLPSPLAPSDPRFRSPIAGFSVVLNPNPLSTRTAAPSATLARMTAALLRDPTLDAQLMPVPILWGRSPKSQDSLIKALFADEWASDTLLETGLVREDADGSLHLRERTRTWERYVERLLPADAVRAIQRVAVDHAPPAPT